MPRGISEKQFFRWASRTQGKFILDPQIVVICAYKAITPKIKCLAEKCSHRFLAKKKSKLLIQLEILQSFTVRKHCPE